MSLLRVATERDLLSILDIVNHEILNGTAIYDYEPRSENEHIQWFLQKQRAQNPIVVAVLNDKVCGFGTYGIFRPKDAYKFSMEHSIYIADGMRSKGIGSSIMGWLIASAKSNGHHTLVAGIDASNESSIHFHERFGFFEVARFKEVGYKFDRWLDLVFMQLMLDNRIKP